MYIYKKEIRMKFEQKTILGLFDNTQKSFIIPVYQRAYSWEKDQWNVLLNDLKEQISGDNNYFFGNLLFEVIQKDKKYEIIDGQQRLTTLTIFFRALLDELKHRSQSENDVDVDFDSKEKMYFKNGGNIKLRPVEYDQHCYDALIVEGKLNCELSTPSQKRIKNCKDFYISELAKLPTSDLIRILEKLESTDLTYIEFEGKKDSALMFELQNNRGKDLTNMEKIKSYFMYQMYVYSPQDETESNIERISNVFKAIYQLINDLKLNEDSVLIYHCNAFIKGFNYRTLDDIKEIFQGSDKKVKWIKNFADELHTTFSNIKKMEKSKLPYLEDMRKLGIPAFVYPFIIKGYKFSNDSDEYLNRLFHILEVLTFRYYLINSRAEIESRINQILIGFSGDLDALKNELQTKLNNIDDEYWSDSRVKNYLNGYMYQNKVLNYVLWQYEAKIQNKGYGIKNVRLENEQIEHISPQSPTNGEMVATGYGEYNEPFKDKYLNCIGNLMLISGSHNASIGNKAFAEKLKTYNANPLLNQQAEIKDFVEISDEDTLSKWGETEIKKRLKKIVDEFALSKWAFNAVL